MFVTISDGQAPTAVVVEDSVSTTLGKISILFLKRDHVRVPRTHTHTLIDSLKSKKTSIVLKCIIVVRKLHSRKTQTHTHHTT